MTRRESFTRAFLLNTIRFASNVPLFTVGGEKVLEKEPDRESVTFDNLSSSIKPAFLYQRRSRL